jgi:hypothetical protein
MISFFFYNEKHYFINTKKNINIVASHNYKRITKVGIQPYNLQKILTASMMEIEKLNF